MARVRFLVQARRCHAPPALEYPASVAPGLADVVRSARQPAHPAMVYAFPGTVAGERAHGDGAIGKKSLSRQAADLCASRVLRLHLCRPRGKGDGPMVGPAIARTVFPCGGAEEPMILSSAHNRSTPMFFREA